MDNTEMKYYKPATKAQKFTNEDWWTEHIQILLFNKVNTFQRIKVGKQLYPLMRSIQRPPL